MQLKQLLADDDAVSPVIGVILMVAITVILAAVIASFVLGLGGETNVSPTADFNFDYNPDAGGSSHDGAVLVTHTGGQSIRHDELFIRGNSVTSGNLSESWSNLGPNTGATASGSSEGVSAVVSGNSANIGVTGDDYILRIVWESTSGESSNELAVDRGPNA
jgi:flagellin-like protein